MPRRPAFTRIVDALPATVPFVGPETQERKRGAPFLARLGANENGFGPSPRAVEAMCRTAPESWCYGDPENHDLKEAIARHLGVAPQNIAVGGGIDGLLGLIVRQYAEPGDPVVNSLGGYPTFNYHVNGFGGQLVNVPYRGDHEDPEALVEAARQSRAKILYFANPDNPMGSWHEAEVVEALIDAVPEDTMLVLDEAYCEFAPASAFPPISIIRPNLLRMRTFSKAYGMAGMRCGYAVGDETSIAAFDKIRNHFGITRITQAACIAALEDQAHLRDTVARVHRARARIGAIAAANGLKALPSATNFVAIDCGRDGAFALSVMNGLVERGIFVRKPAAPGLDRCIRVSCGPDDALDAFAEKLEETLKALG
ncbi:MAG: pyridoxal phosphate-dependent aminotransferase [Notoacmeibacter sp.]|nr:pyridoxal phosphate-dependent aminotransferase [Notoacmeibacter sp.]